MCLIRLRPFIWYVVLWPCTRRYVRSVFCLSSSRPAGLRSPGSLKYTRENVPQRPPFLPPSFFFFLFKFPKMPLRYNYVTASSFIPLRNLPFLEIYSWSSVCFVTQSFESGEHSTAPKAPDGWRKVYIASWAKVHFKFDTGANVMACFWRSTFSSISFA